MEKEDYQANWRGARRYQFDEETRLKKLAMQSRDQVLNFRRVKWADPEHKLKVLVEDFDRRLHRGIGSIACPQGYSIF
jgi:hypothetical protein